MISGHSKLFFSFLIFCCLSVTAFSYERQGTTIKRQGCNIVIIVQVALETDTEADIQMVQNALNDCFGFQCDLPCKDGTTGKCKIIGSVIVVNWKDLSAADKPKFHHITMAPGEGTSYVSGGDAPPNGGKSKTGKWFRHEYSPKVYCHETMHLCGLKDRYRDCRPWRIEAGVDNCKDGKQCTPRQVLDGACPSCDGFEDDVMGQDVTKPYDCTRNMMEILKLANDGGLLSCSDSCCEVHHSAVLHIDSNNHFHAGLIVDGGLAYYHQKSELVSDDKINLWGLNLSVGGDLSKQLNDLWDLLGFAKFNFSTTSGSQSDTRGATSYTGKYHYHFTTLYIGANAIYKLPGSGLSLYGGPDLGFILGAKVKTNSSSFTGVTQTKNIQLAINFGVMGNGKIKSKKIEPFCNLHLPLSNQVRYNNFKNKLTELNVGLIYPISQ